MTSISCPPSFPHHPLTTPGTFLLGCNYWASHAGIAMWSDWQPKVIEADMANLAKHGIAVLRVFPLWPVFQPITALYQGGGQFKEFRLGESPLPDTDAGQAGMSPQAMEKFSALIDLADAHGLKLEVALITGWMSGRLFVPPALERLNIHTDPTALMWQTRFVKHFVKTFKDRSAILAWALGNECNCMASGTDQPAAWHWTATIANAIRSVDATRPVVSSMHSLPPQKDASWNIRDQAELTDVLTTHPYPLFTPYCAQDPLPSMRPAHHAAIESRFYSDIGHRPCLAEEVGVLGPMMICNEKAADYVRASLFSLWAYDSHGLWWWCSHDQNHLEMAPYDWNAVERELGLFTADQQPKPVAKTMAAFGQFLENLPIDRLPVRSTQAVCLINQGLTEWGEGWGVGYASFLLARQAGFDITFQTADQPLIDSNVYLLPSYKEGQGMTRRHWLALLEKVQQGATLYVSLDKCQINPFTEVFGADVQGREVWTSPSDITSQIPGLSSFTAQGAYRLILKPHADTQVLARESESKNPAMLCHAYGQGRIYLLTFPLEAGVTQTPGAFHHETATPFWRIYQHVAAQAIAKRIVRKTDQPSLGLTEHDLGDGRCLVIAVNYRDQPTPATLELAKGWHWQANWRGSLTATGVGGGGGAVQGTIDPLDAAVLVIQKS